MPKFVDNSYILHDVAKLKEDVNQYHNEMFQQTFDGLRRVFLDKEVSNYELVLQLINQLKEIRPDDTTQLDTIWQDYRKLVDTKQFFIREAISDLVSIDDLLDKANKKKVEDQDLLKDFMETKLKPMGGVDFTEYQTLTDKEYLTEELRPFHQEQQNFVVERMSRKYEKLYKNFSGIFFKVIARTMDIDRLKQMLAMIQNVEMGRITQHNASVEIGKVLGQEYLNK